jgi:acyl-CoA synthetase (AMP-forming)/AMP-acid ligase II
MGVDGGVNCLVPSLEATMDAEAWSVPDIPADSIAFLQYTSGSTGRPKGVLVSHGNVMHNLRSISAAIRITDDDIGVNWLPPYHDMGLVGGLLQPVYEGTSVVLMSPVSFLHRPLRWLSTISRVRATVSGGPDFAYDLGAKRITPEQKEGLDLSCWRAALNGAEPIRPATLQAFQEAFAPCGFSPKAWAPCYGLAEATLFVAGGRCDGDVLSHRFDGESLERGLGIVVQESGGVRRREIAASGRPADGLLVEIVHPTEHTPCPPGTVGEIWVQGPSVAQGYWDKIDLSDAAFHACTAGDGKGPFLRTGDLGFLEAGSLFVTGRLQDVITFGSRTLYPQDIENTAHESHPALRRGASAAFGIEAGGETGVVVLCEVERQSMRGLDGGTVVATIRQRVQEEHQVTLSAVLLLRMGAIPRTSSGKIQRRACRDLYSSDRLDALMVGEGERSPTTEASDSG